MPAWMSFPSAPRSTMPYAGLTELERRVPYAGRANAAAEALVPYTAGPYTNMPQNLVNRIEDVAGASGAMPRFQQQMSQVRQQTRNVLGGGRNLAARMGAAAAPIPGVNREAGRVFAEGAGNAAAQFAETAQRGTERAAEFMQPLAAEEASRRRALEEARGRLAGSAFGASMTPNYSMYRRY